MRHTILDEIDRSIQSGSNPFEALADTCIGRIVLRLTRVGMRLLGVVLVLLALGLMSFVGYLFYTRILFMISNDNALLMSIYFLLSVFLGINVYFNYIQCIRTDPGSPSPNFGFNEEEEGQHPHTQRWSKYCNKCQRAKPKRAHHCHLCDKCVLRMDHHCPWIMNCVGLNNHRYFVSFLFYLFVCCFLLCFFLSTGSLGIYPLDEDLYYDSHSYFSFVLLLTSSMTLALGGFFVFHLYLVLTNQTTIEFQFNRLKAYNDPGYYNPYNLGVRENVRQIFGDGSVWSYFLPTLQKPTVDGCRWPSLDNIRRGNKMV